MVAMRTAIILILVLGLLIAGVVILVRRRDRDEIQTIDHYRNALSTLDDMRAPTGRTVRILSEDEARELRQVHADGPILSNKPITHGRLGPIPGANEERFFDDLGEPIPIPAGPIRSHLHHDDPQWALGRMQNRRVLPNRELLAAGGAIAVLLVLVVVGILLGSSGSSSKNSSTTTIPHTTTTQASGTTTTVPTVFQPAPGGSANAATYYVPGTHYVLVVSATQGGCWTTIKGLDGTVLFNSTIDMGSSQTVQRNGGIIVSYGAPGNVSLTLNGVKVALPSGYGAPFQMTFLPQPSATTTTSSTSTTMPPTTTTSVAP